jgi:AmiR/NasT family two-component response regulator
MKRTVALAKSYAIVVPTHGRCATCKIAPIYFSHADSLRMTTALLFAPRPLLYATLEADLQAAGISVLGAVQEVPRLVQSVVQHAPDVVICAVPHPHASWFDSIALIDKVAPCPVLVFTSDFNAKHIEKSVQCGIHGYVIDGYASHRIRPLIQLAQARFTQTQEMQRAHEEIATRLDERKNVDRAKGILMRAQHLSDDDAFRVLRNSAMRSNQRLGQLSEHIIHSAGFAESVNLAGQLRMLSQRLAKLYWLRMLQDDPSATAALLDASSAWVDTNLATLRKRISLPTFGDLLAQVEKSWSALKTALALGPASPQRNDVNGDNAVEAFAEDLLLHAERLTAQLETSGQGAPLQLLNLAGRQRMLAQRYTKLALQCCALDAVQAARAAESMRAVQDEFETALTLLNGMPLSTQAIHQTLETAGITWLQLVAAARGLEQTAPTQRAPYLEKLAAGSETLLGLFDALAEHYEHSLDTLLG